MMSSTFLAWSVAALFAYITNRRLVFRSRVTEVKDIIKEAIIQIKGLFLDSEAGGILEALSHKIARPVSVIHILVAFDLGGPSTIWTCIGSRGSFSFDQKYTRYLPILKI